MDRTESERSVYIEWIRQVADYVQDVCELDDKEKAVLSHSIQGLEALHKPGEAYSSLGPSAIWTVVVLLVGAIDAKVKKEKERVSLKKKMAGTVRATGRYKQLNDLKAWARKEAKRDVYAGLKEYEITRSLYRNLPVQFSNMEYDVKRIINETLKREMRDDPEKEGQDAIRERLLHQLAARIEYPGHMPLPVAYQGLMHELSFLLAKKANAGRLPE